MALELFGGAAVGAVFGELLNEVLRVKDNAVMFKPKLEELEETLGILGPAVKEIEVLNKRINGPDYKKETQILMGLLEEGRNLVRKCSKVGRSNFLKKSRYTKMLEALDKKLIKFHTAHMLAYVAMDQKKTLLLVRFIAGSDYRYCWRIEKWTIVNPYNQQTPLEIKAEIVYDGIEDRRVAGALYNGLGELLLVNADRNAPDVLDEHGHVIRPFFVPAGDGTSEFIQLMCVNGKPRAGTSGLSAADFKQLIYKFRRLRESEVLKLGSFQEDDIENYYEEDEKLFSMFVHDLPNIIRSLKYNDEMNKNSLSKGGNHRLIEELALPPLPPGTSATRSAEHEKEFEEIITQSEPLLKQRLHTLEATTGKLKLLTPALMLLSCFNLVMSFLIFIYLYK